MHLFFYGVLRGDVAQWPFLAGLGPGLPATSSGALYAIPDPRGWYPALTPGEGVVHGICHEAGSVDLATIDAFEGEDYRRSKVLAEIACGTITAAAYLWRSPLPKNAKVISSGDFAGWLAETGSTPFSQR